MQRTPPQASIPPAAEHKDTFQREKRTTRVLLPQTWTIEWETLRAEDSARRPSFPHFMLKLLWTQAAPKGSTPSGHLLEGIFRGIHITEDSSPRDRGLRPLSKAQHRPRPTAPSHTPAPRPHPGRATAPGQGRDRREGSLPLGRCLLHAVAPAAPRGRWPSPRAPPNPHSSGATSAPLNAGPTLRTAALRLPPLPLPPAAVGARPSTPLIGYSRGTAGAERVVWMPLRPAAERKPRPPRDKRALPRRRQGKIMEAAVLPSSRRAPRGHGPRGTPGVVVHQRNPPRHRGVLASRAVRTGTPVAPFRPGASSPGCGRCAAGQG